MSAGFARLGVAKRDRRRRPKCSTSTAENLAHCQWVLASLILPSMSAPRIGSEVCRTA